jgi:hypothetical protein
MGSTSNQLTAVRTIDALLRRCQLKSEYGITTPGTSDYYNHDASYSLMPDVQRLQIRVARSKRFNASGMLVPRGRACVWLTTCMFRKEAES